MADAARVRVWDVPTRLVHWLIVALVGASWWTGETGRLEWHRWSGYTLTGVILFRIYWGFFGSSTARFARFVRGPRGVIDYLRGRWAVAAGHNPLGSWSVLALIVLLVTQVALGLFAVDVDGIESGPLSTYVSFEMGRTLRASCTNSCSTACWRSSSCTSSRCFITWFSRKRISSARW